MDKTMKKTVVECTCAKCGKVNAILPHFPYSVAYDKTAINAQIRALIHQIKGDTCDVKEVNSASKVECTCPIQHIDLEAIVNHELTVIRHAFEFCGSVLDKGAATGEQAQIIHKHAKLGEKAAEKLLKIEEVRKLRKLLKGSSF